MLSMGLRCGGKAAGDPVYKCQGPEESRILLSVYTYSLLINVVRDMFIVP